MIRLLQHNTHWEHGCVNSESVQFHFYLTKTTPNILLPAEMNISRNARNIHVTTMYAQYNQKMYAFYSVSFAFEKIPIVKII